MPARSSSGHTMHTSWVLVSYRDARAQVVGNHHHSAVPMSFAKASSACFVTVVSTTAILKVSSWSVARQTDDRVGTP